MKHIYREIKTGNTFKTDTPLDRKTRKDRGLWYLGAQLEKQCIEGIVLDAFENKRNETKLIGENYEL